ncbi:hypothetical protein OIE63_37395 [Streptomyces sp. NBC_01795]|uniref:hypothetical protein n=1 Tax=unclassified Streptomyces TaxID=2593676 RepID=UPI002DDA359F|nr:MULTISPECIES: hypothetical protein [unclassified Streptomyces]WSA96602.1 hypothetical protein OIE63_37395 [Streptomyces sp. NBC_01795]WSS10773.1 hypothetical protein OG533_01745 [Streptomyces sp. NBC_01186]
MNESQRPDRRMILKAATGSLAAVGLTAAPALAAPTAAVAPGGFPDYRYLSTLLAPEDLAYNPTGEIIFPCVRGTSGRVQDALGRYYLYYAPHDAPGGICLAYSDHIEGPYTEYPRNPIVSRDWRPHYSVSHVSSPHVMWHEERREMWLYFHGENTTTRLARSADGIHFTYDKTVLTTGMLPAGTTEASYARVFAHELPSKKAHFVMLFMGNNTTNHRDIHWGWSADGRDWTFDQKPLIRHGDVGAVNVGGPHLLTRGGSAFVVYNKDKESGGDLLITEVGKDFTLRRHLGRFYDSSSGAPDHGRSAAPSFGTENGIPYMVYESGERLAGKIAIARGRTISSRTAG